MGNEVDTIVGKEKDRAEKRKRGARGNLRNSRRKEGSWGVSK
jgi:hypothetical protein